MSKFANFMNEAVYTKPAQEMLKYFQDKGYDREKQIKFLTPRITDFPEAKKALDILLHGTYHINTNSSSEEKQKGVYKIPTIDKYIGNRTEEFRKTIFKQFYNELDKTMRGLKGKWDGKGSYIFSDKNEYEQAQKIMAAQKEKWNSILLANPENRTSLQVDVADKNFHYNEKSENPSIISKRTRFKDVVSEKPETSKKKDIAVEDFTIRKKKINDSDSDILINGIVIATLSQRRDYVKRKYTDRIRTKMATIRSLHWNSEGLSKLLGKKITAGKSNYMSYDFTDIIGYTSAINNEYIKDEFYRNAKNIKEN